MFALIYRNHRAELVGLGVLTVLSSALSALTVWLLYQLLQALQGSQPGDPSAMVARILGLYVVTALTQAGLSQVQAYRAQCLSENLEAELRSRLLRLLAGVRWEFFLQARSGDILFNTASQMKQIAGYARQLPNVAASYVTALAYLGTCVVLSPALTGLTLLLGLVQLAFLRTYLSRVSQASKAALSGARLNVNLVQEFLDGFKLARSFGLSQRHSEVVDENAREISAIALQMARLSASVQIVQRALMLLVLAAVVLAAVYWAHLAAFRLLALMYAFSRILPLVGQVQNHIGLYVASRPTVEGFEEFISSLESAQENVTAETGRRMTADAEIRVCDVTYRYPVGAEWQTAQMNLVIQAGQIVALVGPSGSGKTTLADLLLGLLGPKQGRILVDGAPLEQEALGRWRRSVGYLSQETFLFHDTVRANLLWAQPDATEEQLRQALLDAAAEFVFNLPDGMDTVVGDRGNRLSGGERQRVGLARALLREPTLLVLDEPTSALDDVAEQKILEALKKQKGRRTVLIVTHRAACASIADVVWSTADLSVARTAGVP